MYALRVSECMESEELWKQFGAWFREQRRAADLTQEETAQAAGITRQHLGAIEKGESGVKRDTLLKLADAIGISRSQVLHRAGLRLSGEDPDEYQRSPASEGDRLRDSLSSAPLAETMTEAEERRLLGMFAGKSRQARQTAEAAIKAILAEFPDLDTDEDTAEPLLLKTREMPPFLLSHHRILGFDVDDGYLRDPSGVMVSEDQLAVLAGLMGQLAGVYIRGVYNFERAQNILAQMRQELHLPRQEVDDSERMDSSHERMDTPNHDREF